MYGNRNRGLGTSLTLAQIDTSLAFFYLLRAHIFSRACSVQRCGPLGPLLSSGVQVDVRSYSSYLFPSSSFSFRSRILRFSSTDRLFIAMCVFYECPCCCRCCCRCRCCRCCCCCCCSHISSLPWSVVVRGKKSWIWCSHNKGARALQEVPKKKKKLRLGSTTLPT